MSLRRSYKYLEILSNQGSFIRIGKGKNCKYIAYNCFWLRTSWMQRSSLSSAGRTVVSWFSPITVLTAACCLVVSDGVLPGSICTSVFWSEMSGHLLLILGSGWLLCTVACNFRLCAYTNETCFKVLMEVLFNPPVPVFYCLCSVKAADTRNKRSFLKSADF